VTAPRFFVIPMAKKTIFLPDWDDGPQEFSGALLGDIFHLNGLNTPRCFFYLEGDLIGFLEAEISVIHHPGLMHENIAIIVRLDKPKSFFCVVPFDSTFSHIHCLSFSW
jgi:hypothetical protein